MHDAREIFHSITQRRTVCPYAAARRLEIGTPVTVTTLPAKRTENRGISGNRAGFDVIYRHGNEGSKISDVTDRGGCFSMGAKGERLVLLNFNRTTTGGRRCSVYVNEIYRVLNVLRMVSGWLPSPERALVFE